jgi:transcriptional regulator with XRE-family HTH domain
MAEHTPLPELLRSTRQQLGLTAEELSIRAGVARAHLLELERGSATSFYSLIYCKQAVLAYARALGIEDQAKAMWSDTDWALREDPNARFSSQVDPPAIALTSQSPFEPALPGSPWVYRGLLLAAAFAVVGVSLFRLNEPDTPEPAPVVLTTLPVVGGSPTAPVVVPEPPPTPVGALTTVAQSGPVLKAPEAPSASAAPAVVVVRPSGASTATPPAAAPAVLEKEVQMAFNRWLSLWSAREVEPYLAMFDPAFPDWQAYSENRRRRMQAAQFIEVKAERVGLRVTGPNEVTVSFVQRYRSDSFSSQDSKELVWRQSPTGPKIIAERRVN